MAKFPKSYVVCCDTREKNGWEFEKEAPQSGKIVCAGMINEYLEEGDYTIQGYEDKIRIERKNGFGELFGNFMPKENKERFEREMERLRPIANKYLIIETNLSPDLLGLSIPQLYKGPPVSALVKWIYSLQFEYNIIPVFAGACGKRIAKILFEEIIRKYNA